MKSDVTYLGKVIAVNTSLIEVVISKRIPSSAPIINGRMYRLGQIGTMVRFPIGNLQLYGLVSSVSNSPSQVDVTTIQPDYGLRFLQVQLIGEQMGNMKFERGIGTFPTINDEVHIVTENDLKKVYGNYEMGLIEVGKHSTSENLSVYLNLHHLVLRHSAILGSTGSGKSNTTAHIIHKVINEKVGSRVLLVDIHGEYASSFSGESNVFQINSSETPLSIPFWTMNFDELSFFLVGRTQGQEKPEDKKLRDVIVKLKRENAGVLTAGSVRPEYITADSPIPFDIRKMWHDFNREVNGTFNTSKKDEQNQESEELIDKGDYKNLIPAQFKPYAMGNVAPFKSINQIMYSYEQKIYSRLKDSRFDFMFNPLDFSDAANPNDLDKLLRQWIDNKKRLTILDLSGVPFELIDITVGLVTRIIFDSMYWGRSESYTG